MAVERNRASDHGALLLHIIGGANVPTVSLRVAATVPLGVLDIFERAVSLRVRPRLFGAVPLLAEHVDLSSVYPIRSRLGVGGVGFRLPDGRERYFWTGKTIAVLDLLTRLAFPVSRVPERATKVWQATP